MTGVADPGAGVAAPAGSGHGAGVAAAPAGSEHGAALAADGLPTDPFTPVTPRYGAASIADILPSALAVLGVPAEPDVLRLADRLAGVRRIAVLLVDGLGAYQVRAAAPYAPVLAGLTGLTLTAGFPSTTPVSLVTLGVGVPPGQHGVLGFTVRDPAGGVLTHIRWRDEPDPVRWQPVPTALQRARSAGVATTVVTRPAYEGSGLTVAANRGAAFRGAGDADALATQMLAALRAGTGPTLVSGYHPDLDAAGHDHGVASPQWRAAVAEVDRLLGRLLDGLPPDAALLVTADHGQFDVPADARTDLAADPRLRAGVELVTGEPRVRYLHVRPGACADVIATWRGVLGSEVRVCTREEFVAEGWFGEVRPEHLGRIGDVVVVCGGRQVVLAGGQEPESVARMIGFHGAATAVEMSIPLLIARPAMS